MVEDLGRTWCFGKESKDYIFDEIDLKIGREKRPQPIIETPFVVKGCIRELGKEEDLIRSVLCLLTHV